MPLQRKFLLLDAFRCYSSKIYVFTDKWRFSTDVWFFCRGTDCTLFTDRIKGARLWYIRGCTLLTLVEEGEGGSGKNIRYHGIWCAMKVLIGWVSWELLRAYKAG